MATAVAEDLKRVSKKKKQVDIGQIPQWRLMVRRFMQSKLSVAGGIVLIIMYLMAIFADFLSPNFYDDIDTNNAWAKPTSISFAGGGPGVCSLTQTLDEKTFTWVYTEDCSTVTPIKFFIHGYSYMLLGIIPTDLHLFGVDPPAKLYLWGADRQGRDLFARTLIGARVSLTVGLVGVAIAVVLGSFLGTVSGYFGGIVDNLMQRTIELIQTFPTLPLWLALAAALPRDLPVVQRFFFISIVLSLVSWTGLARQVRGKVLGYRSADYTAAALTAGSSHGRIIASHMVPNAISHIIVVAALAVPITILGETSLSFLGVGMLPPAVSWGVLLRDAQQVQVVTTYPWLMIPGLAVVLAVLCFNFLGDGLRDAVDPYG
jgi:peptide/nickel transport system permease protein